MTQVFKKIPRSFPPLPLLLPSSWVIQAPFYPPFVWPCRRGTDVLIHQNRTAPFTGWTPASKAAPPAGTNSCPPVLNTRPPRARARSPTLTLKLLQLQLCWLVQLLWNALSKTMECTTSQCLSQGCTDWACWLSFPMSIGLTLTYEHLKVAINYSTVGNTQRV